MQLEKNFNSAVKNFCKICVPSKQPTEVYQGFLEMEPVVLNYITSLDNRKTSLSESTKNSMKSLSKVMYTYLRQANGEIITDEFIDFFEKILALITNFSPDDELMQMLWIVIFWGVTTGIAKFPDYNRWNICIVPFFPPQNALSHTYISFIRSQISDISNEAARYWWKIFTNIIFQQLMDFETNDTSQSKYTPKILSKQAISSVCYFIYDISQLKPQIDLFTTEDFNSCMVVTQFLQHIVYQDIEKYGVLISAIAINLFHGELSQENPTITNDSYAFSNISYKFSKSYKNTLLQVIPMLSKQSQHYITSIIVLLLRDIERFYPDVEKSMISILRFRAYIKILIKMGLNTQYFIVLSTAFFFIATDSMNNAVRFSLQIYRMFFEFTYLYKLTSIDSWKYIATSMSNLKDLRSIFNQYATQFIICAVPVIFGTKISEFHLPPEAITDHVALERHIFPNSTVSILPYFTKMDFIDWTYQEVKDYLAGLLEVFPVAENFSLLLSIAKIIKYLANLAPHPSSNYQDMCKFLLTAIPINIMTYENFETIFNLSMCIPDLDIKYITKLSEIITQNLKKKIDLFDNVVEISLSHSVAMHQIIVTVANYMIDEKIPFDSVSKIIIARSALALNHDLADKIIEVADSSFKKPLANVFINLAADYSIISQTPQKSVSLIEKCLKDNSSVEILSAISALAHICPSIFIQSKISSLVLDNKKTFEHNWDIFSASLLAYQDICVATKNISKVSSKLSKLPNEKYTSMVRLTEFAILDALDMNEPDNFWDSDSILVKQSNIYGKVDPKLHPILPEPPRKENQVKFEIKQSNNNILKEQLDVEMELSKALGTTEGLSPKDFNFPEANLPNIKLPDIEEQKLKELSDDDKLNSYYSLFNRHPCKRTIIGMQGFETFHAEIICSKRTENFERFLQMLGEKEEDKVVFKCYRMKVVYTITNSESNENIPRLIWCNGKVDDYLSHSNNCFVVVDFGDTVASVYREKVCTNRPDVLAKIIPWYISFFDENMQKSKRNDICAKVVCK